jgi:hypothetical protein
MTSQSALRRSLVKERKSVWVLMLVGIMAAFFTTPLLAQQTGDIAGRVTDASDGSPIADVSIEATSPNLPGVRVVNTSANGEYLLPFLPVGTYTVTYTLQDGSTRVRQTDVQLQQRSQINLAVDLSASEAVMEEVVVVGTSMLSANAGEAAITAAISNDTFDALPVGQEYRDLVKLVPGVQYTEDTVRGPSAGGNGQDNTYQFDGVDVSLPMFGTLSAEPSTHDIDQVSIIRGGAKAIGFNRSGGVTINTTSKSGTDEFHGGASYQTQTAGMTSARKNDDAIDYDEDKSWITANIGGPIIKEKLYFYGSYYRPEVKRNNIDNVYGPVPNYKSVRNEYFAKLTYAPTDNLLLDASYRTSKRTAEKESVGTYEAATASAGSEATQDIGIVEASWVINDKSNAYFKYTNFKYDTSGQPDTVFSFPISEGDNLNVSNLDQQGYFNVPTPRAGEDAYNAFIQPLIDKYGYVEDGMKMGGGAVGGYSQFNEQDFSRDSVEIGYDYILDLGNTSHALHVGYHTEKIQEDLTRSSNAWGTISAPGGRLNVPIGPDGVPLYFQTDTYQSTFDDYPNLNINSQTRSQNFEFNDTINWENFTFNLGLLISQDTLYGQGLKRNSDNLSGYELAVGHRYEMYKIDPMLQPRLGIIWDANDRTSVFANYARYYPSASSLARAASWDRNSLGKVIRSYYDADGTYLASEQRGGSSGKMFQKDMDPRHIDEYLLGVSYVFTERLTGRAHVRYRAARDFWEDTNNNARIRFEAPAGIPRELYIPVEENEFVSASSYVIAQLDDAYTDYWELNLEAEWRGDNYYVQGSYVYSDYSGNFDQDNTSSGNDDNLFIGSSNLADSAGRQLWDLKDGTLRGDRPHQFKLYGFYELKWNAGVGAYFIYQSGQPWEAWDVEVYRRLAGSSTSDTIRYAEPAGSRRTSSHAQLDLNYTQNFYLGAADRYNIQLRADIFNVFDSQTGYNVQPSVNSNNFGEPRSWFNPRRVQLMAKFIF